jgi:Tfp pilus assembly protein PilO
MTLLIVVLVYLAILVFIGYQMYIAPEMDDNGNIIHRLKKENND